jgi:hypothetical protein
MQWLGSLVKLFQAACNRYTRNEYNTIPIKMQCLLVWSDFEAGMRNRWVWSSDLVSSMDTGSSPRSINTNMRLSIFLGPVLWLLSRRCSFLGRPNAQNGKFSGSLESYMQPVTISSDGKAISESRQRTGGNRFQLKNYKSGIVTLL